MQARRNAWRLNCEHRSKLSCNFQGVMYHDVYKALVLRACCRQCNPSTLVPSSEHISSMTIVHGLLLALIAGSADLAHAALSPEWAALNQSVGGRLGVVTPLALPCFSEYNNVSVTPSTAECATVQANYTSPYFRTDAIGAYMQPQWETCQRTNAQCLLDFNDPSDPSFYNKGQNCAQGGLSSYYIELASVSDIQAAFNFSTKYNVPLSIKNTGHDYKGRSSGAGTLSLWTHLFNTTTFHEDFVPAGCNSSESESYRAITMGAGIHFATLYELAEQNNATFVGGYAATVGASGGWVMGGGHSVLSPVYGLGIDRVLEFKIVTPDGRFRIANSCQNSDLFWALRGGGGGTFGVVVESTTKVEPRMQLQVASFSFNNTEENIQGYYETLTEVALDWANKGWGGHVNKFEIAIVNPLITLEEAQESVKPMADWILSQNGTVVVETLPSFYDFFQEYLIEQELVIGVELTIGGRLLPGSVLETAQGRSEMVQALLSVWNTGGEVYIPWTAPYLYNYTEGSTSATPAWRDAIWNVGGLYSFNSTSVDYVQAGYAGAHYFSETMRKIAPNSGAYQNEADLYERDHEESFWGPNYPRLLEIKKKYDPTGLLDCWQCVGWKGATEDRYSCYLPTPPSNET